MSRVLQRLRAIFTTAMLWAGTWILAWTGLLTIFWLLGGRSGSLLDVLRIGAVLWGAFGAINGIVFAVLLMLAERHRTLEQLSRTRVALWGALGGALFPVVLYLPILAIPGFTVLGLSSGGAGVAAVLTSSLINGIVGAAVATLHLSLARRLPAAASAPQLTDGAAT
jgi:hypothetical protein